MEKMLVLIMVFGAVTFSYADTKRYQYNLDQVPKQGASCHEVTAQVASLFKEANRVHVVSFVTIDETEKGCDVEIIYEAEEPVKKVSTDVPFLAIDTLGRYASEEVCLEKLAEEIQLFESETGIGAVFSYCMKERYGHRYPWFPFIEGFGEATKYPQVSGFHFFGIPEDLTYEQFVDGISKALTKKKLALTGVLIRSAIAYARASVHYYAEKRISFSLKEFTKTEKLEWCTSQITQAKKIFAMTDNRPALVYCGRIQVGNYWELTVLFAGDEELRPRKSLETFESFLECEEKRPDVLAYYQEVLKQPILGGLCSRDERRHRLILFEPILL